MRIFRLLSILMIIWGMSAPMACEDKSDEPGLMSEHKLLAIHCLLRVVAPPTSYNEFLYADLVSFVWHEQDDNYQLKIADNMSDDDGYKVSPQVSIPKSVLKSANAPYINSHGTIFIKDGAGAYQKITKIQLFRVPNISKLTRVGQKLWDVTYKSGHAELIKDGSGTLMLSKVVEDRVDFEDDPSDDGQEPDTDDDLDTLKKKPCPASIKEIIRVEIQNSRDEADKYFSEITTLLSGMKSIQDEAIVELKKEYNSVYASYLDIMHQYISMYPSSSPINDFMRPKINEKDFDQIVGMFSRFYGKNNSENAHRCLLYRSKKNELMGLVNRHITLMKSDIAKKTELIEKKDTLIRKETEEDEKIQSRIKRLNSLISTVIRHYQSEKKKLINELVKYHEQINSLEGNNAA